MNNVLTQIADSEPKIKALAITSKDGWVFAQHLGLDLDEDLVSSMAAAVFAVSRQASGRLLLDAKAEEIKILCQLGMILIAPFDNEVLLVIVAEADLDWQPIFKKITIEKRDLITLAVNKLGTYGCQAGLTAIN